ncbi:hypothetical protein SRABI26_00346 [Arthrobacter sp. Bi26]|nr:hypothetical protein SRABI26_00346 [Arthrobacter sp. Bi26]
MKWRNVGVGTIDSILQALADASTSMATPAVTSDLPSFEQPQLEIPPTLLVTQPKVLPT